MLVPCVALLQQESNTNLGMGGIKIFALFFRKDSKQHSSLTCSRRMTSGVYTASPKRCHPPSPGSFTASDRVSSTCLKRTLVFPKRSSTTTDNASKPELWIRLATFSSVLELTLIKGACQPLPNEGHVGDFSPTETALLEKILQCPA